MSQKLKKSPLKKIRKPYSMWKKLLCSHLFTTNNKKSIIKVIERNLEEKKHEKGK